MKKLILALVAVFAMTTVTFAQENDNARQQNRQRFDPAEMIKRRTEQMVKTYNLTEQQAEQIKALNEKYMSNMGRGGQRQGNGMGQRRQNGEGNGASAQSEQRADRQQRPQGGMRGGFGFNNEEYTAELKKILTEEQFKAYQEDMEKMRQNRRPGGNGNWGGRRNRQE